jgi:accessory colonization factor AcfC
MSRKLTVVIMVIGLAAGAGSIAAAPAVLRAYGPGGPFGPMNECARLFTAQTGIKVTVVAGPEGGWIARAKQDADLIFGGAEYMLSQFILRHPGLVDLATVTSLWVRRAGILVRKGNPKGIRGLSDLARPGVRLLVVAGAGQVAMWEDLAGRRGLIPKIRKNIGLIVPNTARGLAAWQKRPDLDAWVNFASWALRKKGLFDVVNIPDRDNLYRGTPIAVTAISRHRLAALRFIRFLKSPRAHAVFRKWGWK